MQFELDLYNDKEQIVEKEFRIIPIALYSDKLSKKEFIRALEDNDLNLNFSKEDLENKVRVQKNNAIAFPLQLKEYKDHVSQTSMPSGIPNIHIIVKSYLFKKSVKKS